jgi:hypothetical protein
LYNHFKFKSNTLPVLISSSVKIQSRLNFFLSRNTFMNSNPSSCVETKSPHGKKRIATFFYGSFMRREVMTIAGFEPATIEVAKLRGYDIDFDPHANVFRSDEHSICGILVYPSHEELNKMYSRDGVGVFLPEAVIVETNDNRQLPAMCYMPPARGTQSADLAYLGRIIETAQGHQFPAWYLNRLESIRLRHQNQAAA